MTMERLTKCPLCKSGLFLNHSEVKDHSVSGETFFLCQCSNCKLIFTNPRPYIEFIGKYYESEEYISHQNKSTNLTNKLYKFVRQLTIRKKVALINTLHPNKGKLLDIGCGTGYFIEAAERSEWKVKGIEPNSTARKLAQSKNLKVSESLKDINDNKKFDVITLFHVLEHMHNLRKSTKKIVELLNDNGTLIIAVPNFVSFDSKYYGSNWAGLDVPRHLYHFNKISVQKLAEEFNLRITETKPMKFDSFYVSILSEKYLKPNNNSILHLIKGGINGLKSNIWAKNNENNYSSLLFILKKK